MGFADRQKKVTTTLDLEDWKFLKAKNIKPAHILRNFCIKKRSLDAGAFEESIETLKATNEIVRTRLQRTFTILNEILTKEQLDEILEKI